MIDLEKLIIWFIYWFNKLNQYKRSIKYKFNKLEK